MTGNIRPVTRGRREGEDPPRKFPFLEKCVGHKFKNTGHSSKNLGLSSITLRPSWCHKLVTGLENINTEQRSFRSGIGPPKPQQHIRAKLKLMHHSHAQITFFYQRNTLLHLIQF